MRSAGTITPIEALSENQRAALVSLLADDDPGVYQAVHERILACGPPAVAWLRPHSLSGDPVLRRRVLGLIRHFERQTGDTQFLAFCLKQGEELDLEQGAWLLAQTQYPDINVEAYRALLDGFASELRERIETPADAHSLLHTINDYFFIELGFCGNQEHYYDPENSYLNRVIDRRTGNPISLCLIYLLLARRLRLPVAGIGLPGHFVCRYQSTAVELYLDLFNGGKFLTKADCVHYLVEANFSVRDDYLTPVSPRRMLLRICSNLHQIYLQLDRAEETTRIQRYLVALAR